jgi:hypothetical protein
LPRANRSLIGIEGHGVQNVACVVKYGVAFHATSVA